MDTIATIIATAFINIAISTFLFYRYQKSVDLSFAKKLKEFESSIQRSLFEQQTSFLRSYSKQAETLETSYQKFVIFSEDFQSICLEVAIVFNHLITSDDYQRCETELNEFWQYFIKNRLNLPSELAFEITEIYFFCEKFVSLLPYIMSPKNFELDSVKQMVRLKLAGTSLNESMVNWEKLDFSVLLTTMAAQIAIQTQTLEEFYRSAVSTKPAPQ